MKFLFIVVALGLAGCGGTPSSSATKDTQVLGQNYYASGLPSWEFIATVSPFSSGRQRMTNWCWAATSQMVLNWHGVNTTQEDLVTKLFGELVDQPATASQIETALDGWGVNTQGGDAFVNAEQIQPNQAFMITELHDRNPLIAGLRDLSGGSVGHAYVVYAITWYYDTNGAPDVYQVFLEDPWPGADPEAVSWSDFVSRIYALLAVRVTNGGHR